MGRFWKIFLLLAVIRIYTPDSYSQKLSDTLSIEEIRIHTIRSLKSTSLTRTSIDSMVLLNKANNSLSEVLADHSGIYIKTYGRGAMATASFRGTDPSHTKVMWNGIELNSPMLGMVDFSLIPVFFTDNVDLLHGSSSLSETTGALGGLISLSTGTDWTKSFSGSYMQGAGSFGSHDEHLRFKAGNSKIQSETRLFYSHSDNDFSFVNHDIIDSVDLETGRKYYPTMKNEDAWFSCYGILQEVRYRPGANDLLSFSFWGQESSRSIPLLSTSESGPNNNINRQEDNSVRGQVSYSHFSDKFRIKAFSGINYMDLDYSQKNRVSDEIYLPAIDSRSKSGSWYNKIETEYIISGDLRVELGAGADFHTVNSFEEVKNLGYDKSRVQGFVSGAVYKNWNEKWKSNLRMGSDFMADSPAKPLFHAGTEFHILPGDRLFLRMVLASNSKYPSLNDLYYQPGGNSALKPERSMDQEFGAHFNIEKGRLVFNQDVSFYASQVKNWIMWYYTVRGFSPENIEKVDIKGFETNTSLSYSTDKTLIRLACGYTLAHSRDMAEVLSETDLSYGKQLPYIPVHSSNAMVYLMRNNWSFTYIWNYYSKRNTSSSNEEGSPRDYLYPYFMNQAGLGKFMPVGRGSLDVNLKVHNLFNEEYRSILQRPMPGRNFSLQLKFSF